MYLALGEGDLIDGIGADAAMNRPVGSNSLPPARRTPDRNLPLKLYDRVRRVSSELFVKIHLVC
jgi:hypothetical protein